MEFKNELMNIMYGFFHLLVAFTAIVVVSTLMGFNLPSAFFFAGISTIIFHIFTGNRLPSFLGVSGLYIGSIMAVNSTYGPEYVGYGVVAAGILYVIMACIVYKYPNFIGKYLPEWLMATAVILIGLSLISIGASISNGNILLAGITFASLASFDLINNKFLNYIKFPLAIGIGILTAVLLGIQIVPQTVALELVRQNKFNLGAIITIMLFAIPTIMEMLGDTKNITSIAKVNIYDIGWHRVFLGNGLAVIVSGLFGSAPYTTYSENASFLITSDKKNPNIQLYAALFAICLAFITPLFGWIAAIPAPIFGGIIVYLFALTIVNGIKILHGIHVDYEIVGIMIAASFLSFSISGIAISSTAVGIVVGIIANFVKNRNN